MSAQIFDRDQVFMTICQRIAMGEGLRTICRDKGMPHHGTVLGWVRDDPKLEQVYRQAREIQAHVLAERIIEIANTPLIGVKTKTNARGKVIETISGDMIEHRKLQIDALKWYLSKVLPKVYGDRLSLAGDKDSPLIVTVRRLAAPVNPDGS